MAAIEDSASDALSKLNLDDESKTSEPSPASTKKSKKKSPTPSYMKPVKKTPEVSRRRSRKSTAKEKTPEELQAIKDALAEKEEHTKGLFLQYTKQKPSMDGRTFVQFARNAGLMKKRGKTPALTQTDLDLAHTKAKRKGQKGLNFREFQKALVDCADRSKTTINKILEVVDQAPSPTFKGTRGASRFHDNRNSYTGTFAHGGPPSTNDLKTNIHDISQTCNRKVADVRGVVDEK